MAEENLVRRVSTKGMNDVDRAIMKDFLEFVEREHPNIWCDFLINMKCMGRDISALFKFEKDDPKHGEKP